MAYVHIEDTQLPTHCHALTLTRSARYSINTIKKEVETYNQAGLGNRYCDRLSGAVLNMIHYTDIHTVALSKGSRGMSSALHFI